MLKSHRPVRIGISLGKHVSAHDGIGEFGRQLVSRFARSASRLHGRFGVEFFIHCKHDLHGIFGSDVRYLNVHWAHKFFHFSSPAFQLWHWLDQFNGFAAPFKTDRRITTIHDLNYLYSKGPGSRKRGKRRVQGCLNRSTRIVTISNYVRGDITSNFRPDLPVDVVYNGARSLVNLDGMEPLPWAKGRRFLFHLSRMTPAKNVFSIISLAKAWPQMNFVLAGPARSESLALARDLVLHPLSNVCVQLDVSDAMKAWLYSNCSGFLFPSLTEGFGLPPIEAMHFGKPVFLSDRTCLPEIGGDAAYYLTDFAPESMRSVIEPAIDPVVAASRAERVRNRARTFDWDLTAQGYLDAYSKELDIDLGRLSDK